MAEIKMDIKSLTFEELQEQMTQIGEKKFRAAQIYQWMHEKLAEGFHDMQNLSGTLKEKLEERYSYTLLRNVTVQESAQDGTKKFLFELQDGSMVESVLMKYKHGNSVCISSQVGCRMGCVFCASTQDGLERSLLPSEMLEQVYAISRHINERVSNVVVMGMGEPLDNYENLVRFIRLLNDEKGLHISQRNVTVSTCGIVPMMRRLAGEGLQITLALSLHAAQNEKRSSLMPVAKKYPLDELMDACTYYFEKTGRRITFEYSLVNGINDTQEDAGLLSSLLKGKNAHVNLIPVNPVRGREFKPGTQANAVAFKNKLEKNKINVTIRREMGRDIDGACGQLRGKRIHRTGQEV